MTPQPQPTLARDIIDAFDQLSGRHPGFRPAHAKGILLSGTFTPSPEGAALTRAPHLHRQSTPVWVRFSDFAGIPNISDNDPNASPRGIAIRFYLAEHVHTDITAHSIDGFPAHTAEEFLEFLHTAANPALMPGYLATHPAAREFVTTPQPMPASFSTECFFAVNAYRFTSERGETKFGRYRIRPAGDPAYLDAATAAAAPPDFLFDELRTRIAERPIDLKVLVQLAEEGDIVDNSTVHWPETRTQILLGDIHLTTIVENNSGEQQRIIFDAIPRVDGIDPSGDPLLEPRAATYLVSGRRRRADGAPQTGGAS